MSQQIPKICTAGHGFRVPPSRMTCDCGKPLVLKTSPEGQAILAARDTGKKKLCTAGYQGRDNKAGVRPKHLAYGDPETATPLPL